MKIRKVWFILEQINSVYTDAVEVSFNIFNVTIGINILEDKQIPLGKIKMSPQTAKAFSRILKENLDQYEEIYGPINEYTKEIAAKEREFNEKMKEMAEKNLKELKDSEEIKKIKEEHKKDIKKEEKKDTQNK